METILVAIVSKMNFQIFYNKLRELRFFNVAGKSIAQRLRGGIVFGNCQKKKRNIDKCRIFIGE